MATRKNPSRGKKPDAMMRHTLMLELARERTVKVKVGDKEYTRRFRNCRLVAQALVTASIEDRNVAAIREIYDRVDGKVPHRIIGRDGDTGADLKNVTLGDLIAMSFEVGRSVGAESEKSGS